MSSADEKPTNDLSKNEESAGKNFLQMAAPFLFEKAVLQEKDESGRIQVVRKFVQSPLTNFETVKRFLGYGAHLLTEEGRAQDGQVVLACAKMAMNIFLNERTDIVKNGISFQHGFEGKVVHTIGQVLNEGVTEWITRKVSREYLSDKGALEKLFGDTTEEETKALLEHAHDGTYFFEVKCAELLMVLVGEDIVTRAYFSPEMEDWYALASAFDSKHEPRSFFRFLSLTDNHKWREAFSLLTPRESDGARHDD